MLENKNRCPLCVRSQIHARKHGNDHDGVVCLPHRVLNWLLYNSYAGKVAGRNPVSADKYSLYERTIEIPEGGYYLDLLTNSRFLNDEDLYKYYRAPPIFSFPVIARTEMPIVIEYTPSEDVLTFFPSVIADVKDGEYRNRRLILIYGVWNKKEDDYEWGVLFDGYPAAFMDYVGYSRMHACINTCVYGRAKPTIPDKDIQFFRQRKECSKCIPLLF